MYNGYMLFVLTPSNVFHLLIPPSCFSILPLLSPTFHLIETLKFLSHLNLVKCLQFGLDPYRVGCWSFVCVRRGENILINPTVYTQPNFN